MSRIRHFICMYISIHTYWVSPSSSLIYSAVLKPWLTGSWYFQGFYESEASSDLSTFSPMMPHLFKSNLFQQLAHVFCSYLLYAAFLKEKRMLEMSCYGNKNEIHCEMSSLFVHMYFMQFHGHLFGKHLDSELKELLHYNSIPLHNLQ